MFEIVYFELNNWACGEDYPNAEPFLHWMGNDLQLKFNNEVWVKKNRLCVVRGIVDMSVNFCISATKDWVIAHCPSLLTEHQKFLRYPDKYGEVEGRFGHSFLPYSEENFGITDCDLDED